VIKLGKTNEHRVFEIRLQSRLDPREKETRKWREVHDEQLSCFTPGEIPR
jgi:hypothetical protein